METYEIFKNIAIPLENIKPFSFTSSIKDNQDFTFFTATSNSHDDLLLCVKKRYDVDLSPCFQSFHRFEKETKLKPIFIFQIPLTKEEAYSLIKAGISFFDPKGNSFVPFMSLALDLYYKANVYDLNYSSCCQQIASVFLFSNLTTISSVELASLLEVSQPTVSRGLEYFLGTGLIEKIGPRNKTRYRLSKPKSDFVEAVLFQSINPIRQTYYVDKEHLPNVKMDILSSESALEKLSLIRAFHKAYVANEEESHLISSVATQPWALFPNVEYIRFDVLMYKPILFGKNHINPLDVYGIYRNDNEPRMREALYNIKESIQ
jgi:DNA-binding transcriptional ArsR family regulator